MILRVIIHVPSRKTADVLNGLHSAGVAVRDVLCDEDSASSHASQVVITPFVSEEQLQEFKRALQGAGGDIDSTIFDSAFAH